jgi:hypothetical protein
MQQNHSFFSSPNIFFGSHHDQEQSFDDEEDPFSEVLNFSLNSELKMQPQVGIGLFILWTELHETE